MKKILLYSLVLLLAACKEKYESPVKSPVTGYLVVEGVVNSGAGATSITLSRTTPLNNRNIQLEQGAQVKVEGDDNNFYTLTETSPGHYTNDNLNLSNSRKYRLNIKTSNGKAYISDYVAVVINPPIDSISWLRENGGVQIYISTHNPLDNTRYYHWEYNETWEFHSSFVSTLKYKIDKTPQGDIYSVVFRYPNYQPDMTIYTCWNSHSSTEIILGSSAKLNRDAIYLPLVFIPHASKELSVLYSIDVKQYGLTKEAYQFLDKMKKNTEATGSIFDAQPSELNGNIHCITDPTEPVIGYFNVCALQEKRIFISISEVPNWGYISGCQEMEIENISDSIVKKGLGYIPSTVAKSAPFGPGIASFYASTAECIDCTLSGTNVKPSFWP